MAGQLNTDVATISPAASSVAAAFVAGADINGLNNLLAMKARECLRLATQINSLKAGADSTLASVLVTVLADLA